MELSMIFSVIGIVTGLVALILQYINYKQQTVKLVFKLVEKLSFTANITEHPLPLLKSTEHAILCIRISNCCAYPITIENVDAKRIDKGAPHEHLFIDERVKFILPSYDEDGHKVSLRLYPQAELPLRIDAFDSKYVSFLFTNADDLQKPYLLTFETPRKKFTFRAHPLLLSELIGRTRRKFQ